MSQPGTLRQFQKGRLKQGSLKKLDPEKKKKQVSVRQSPHDKPRKYKTSILKQTELLVENSRTANTIQAIRQASHRRSKGSSTENGNCSVSETAKALCA